MVQNMCTWSPEKGSRSRKKIFEQILAKSFPNLWRTVSTQISNLKLRKHYENYKAHHTLLKIHD